MKALMVLLGFLHAPVGGEPNYGTRCLAAVGYSEARSESPTGEACVIRNVLNRAVVRRAPICDVAMEANQYAHPTHVVEPAWTRSQLLADFVIADAWPMPAFCYHALHFHQSHEKAELGRIGVHGFYP